MMTLVVVFLLAVPAPAVRVAAAAGGPPVRIAAAANLSGALDEVAKAWTKSCGGGCEPSISYGASGNFAAQIQNGAPYDLFLAADTVYPQKLTAAGLAEGDAVVYAHGKLALWVPRDSPLPIEKQGVAALADPKVLRIAIANPVLAPYGKLALQALKAQGQDDPKRLVLGESVGQAAQQAQSGNVQAALLPLSLVLLMPGRHVELPGTLDQAGVVLKSATNRAQARAFLQFLVGAEARQILARRGYAP